MAVLPTAAGAMPWLSQRRCSLLGGCRAVAVLPTAAGAMPWRCSLLGGCRAVAVLPTTAVTAAVLAGLGEPTITSHEHKWNSTLGYMASSPLMTKRKMTVLTPGHIREVIAGMDVGGFGMQQVWRVAQLAVRLVLCALSTGVLVRC